MTDNEFISLPASYVLSKQREYVRERQRLARNRARYELGHPERAARDIGRQRGGKGHGAVLAINKEFIVWDGEGPQDTDYSLFGNSKGMEICRPGPLGTKECLDLILETKTLYPDSIQIIFGGNYDVTQILKTGLPRRKFVQLLTRGECHWDAYIIHHVPRKWLTVKHGATTVKIYDVSSFFDGGLVATLEDWDIGPFSMTKGNNDAELDEVPPYSVVARMTEAELVRTFKRLRSKFYWRDMDSIKLYMRLELKYTKLLMERVRQALYQVGYLPSSWHGPGAIASMAMRKHGVYKCMAECPKAVREAAKYAYAGGRFEMVLGGHAQAPVYVYDIHSAYPYFAATHLPNLAKGAWREGREYEAGKFAVYRIRYRSKGRTKEEMEANFFRIFPLFRRTENHEIHFCANVEGWYWAPEAELVADDPDAEFLEAWIFDEENSSDRPFSFLRTYYDRKESAKNRGDRAGWVWKKIINAVYGQCARRTGWDRKNRTPPKSHQLEWAGYITSACRAAVYRAALECGDRLISIDTDGITTLAPCSNLAIGGNLGEWAAKRYADGVFWQVGIYFLKDEKTGEWSRGEAKTRGIPKGVYKAEDLIAEIERVPELTREDRERMRDERRAARSAGLPMPGVTIAETRKLTATKQVFVTYNIAQMSRWDQLGTWLNQPYEYEFGGKGKRSHVRAACPKDCADLPGHMHRLKLRSVMFMAAPGQSIASIPHNLPWETEDESDMGPIEDGDYIIDIKHLEGDDMQWVTAGR
jgi:hypothetical protein